MHGFSANPPPHARASPLLAGCSHGPSPPLHRESVPNAQLPRAKAAAGVEGAGLPVCLTAVGAVEPLLRLAKSLRFPAAPRRSGKASCARREREGSGVSGHDAFPLVSCQVGWWEGEGMCVFLHVSSSLKQMGVSSSETRRPGGSQSHGEPGRRAGQHPSARGGEAATPRLPSQGGGDADAIRVAGGIKRRTASPNPNLKPFSLPRSSFRSIKKQDGLSAPRGAGPLLCTRWLVPVQASNMHPFNLSLAGETPCICRTTSEIVPPPFPSRSWPGVQPLCVGAAQGRDPTRCTRGSASHSRRRHCEAPEAHRWKGHATLQRFLRRRRRLSKEMT